MERFDNVSLSTKLAAMPARLMLAFVCAVASRQLCNYERHAPRLNRAGDQRPREIAAQIWAIVHGMPVVRVSWQATLDEVEQILPKEDTDWVWHALADDAVMSLAYAIECVLGGGSDQATWAAQHAYAAADQAVIRILYADSDVERDEEALLSHEWVQRELGRQRRDLDLLRAGAIDDVQQLSQVEEHLTDAEWASISLA
jgi:uncharacterized protein YjaG (DUF416 family)